MESSGSVYRGVATAVCLASLLVASESRGQGLNAAGSQTTPTTLITLPHSGYTLALPANNKWRVVSADEWARATGKSLEGDMLIRTQPAQPGLAIGFVHLPRRVGCGVFMAEWAQQQRGAYWPHTAGWTPLGWGSSVTLADANGMAVSYHACAEKHGSLVLASIYYEGSATEAAFEDAVRPVLAAFGSASRIGGQQPVREMGVYGVFLSLHQTAPDVDGPETAFGGELSAELILMAFTGSSHIGGGGDFRLAFGWNLASGLTFDLRLGLGAAIRLGPVALMGIAGIGGDAVGIGSDPGDPPAHVDVPGEAYAYLGGFAQVWFSRTALVELYGARSDRVGPFSGTRLSGRLSWRKSREVRWIVGATYQSYGALGRIVSADLGFSF